MVGLAIRVIPINIQVLPGEFPMRITVSIFVFFLMLLSRPLWACDYMVTVGADGDDGVCDAHCTLREAVSLANATPGPEVVCFSIATATLGLMGSGEDYNATGDIDITDDTTFLGSGVHVFGIGQGLQADRVFHIIAGLAIDPVVVFQDMGIHEGGGVSHGGGIYNQRNSILTLNNCEVSGNSVFGRSSAGGGIESLGPLELYLSQVIYNNVSGLISRGGGIRSAVSLYLEDSDVSNNAGADGGGGVYADGPIRAYNSVFIDNTAVNTGGGIWAEDLVLFDGVSVRYNTLTSYPGHYGAGLYVNGSWNNELVTILRSGFVGNACATCIGGGMYIHRRPAMLEDVILLQNTANHFGGGGFFSGTGVFERVYISNNTSRIMMGGGLYLSGQYVVRDSAFDFNTAAQFGGGLLVNGTVDIDGSRFYGNTAGSTGGGIAAQGGSGVHYLTITNSSINRNTANFGSGIASLGGIDTVMENVFIWANGGSIGVAPVYLGGSVNMEWNNVTVWGNFDSKYVEQTANIGASATLRMKNSAVQGQCTGSVVSLGHNTEGVAATCIGSGVGDHPGAIINYLVGLRPALGKSRALALSTSTSTYMVGHGAVCAANDIFNVSRPLNCTVGAVEAPYLYP